jgi:hypothetical protein
MQLVSLDDQQGILSVKPLLGNERAFRFDSINTDGSKQLSYRIDLGDTPPTFTLLQRIFQELYTQRQLTPQYLFASEKDYNALRREIIDNMDSKYFIGLLTGDKLQFHFTEVPNQVIGGMVDLVPLPCLEQGSVIVGFFK